MKIQKVFEWLSCGWKLSYTVFLVCAAGTMAARAQTFTTLMDFVGRNGELPSAAVVQGLDGSIYGTTEGGGANNSGVVYKLKRASKDTILYSFCSEPNCVDGAGGIGGAWTAGLVLANDGNFYGTTPYGGDHGGGTIFRITPTGILTTLYSFCSLANCADGEQPTGSLVQAVDGNLYGTASAGGTNAGGTVFRITPSGMFTNLYNFCGQAGCLDGDEPVGGLVQAVDGDLYGTTYAGGVTENCFGNPGCGTIFKITPAGGLTTVYAFCPNPVNGYECTDGVGPMASLIQAADGDFYGTTTNGGLFGSYCYAGCGTVFKITPQGVLTTVNAFCQQTNCADGAIPSTPLAQATDGNFYGTTGQGGYNSEMGGTIFQMTPAGQLTTLYKFCSQSGCTDGDYVSAGLIQDTDGSFYGTTWEGGVNKCHDWAGCGTVFKFDMGLGPFVTFIQRWGKIGSRVGILGTDMDGATSVTFNGIPAQFTVALSTLIVARVPQGATTGTIQVTLPQQTLTSNVPFQVLN